MISDQSAKTYNLILTSKVIELAKARGVYFGFGKEQNRLRYLIKLGLLPHQQRQYRGKRIDTYLPDFAVERLVEIQKLQDNQNLKIPQIIQRYQELESAKDRHLNNLASIYEANASVSKQKQRLTKRVKKLQPIIWRNIIKIPLLQIPKVSISKNFAMATLIIPIILFALLSLDYKSILKLFPNSFYLLSTNKSESTDFPPLSEFKGDVLSAKDINTSPILEINIPINAYGQNINLQTGQITASNIVYELVAGQGITISGDAQRPTISITEAQSAVNKETILAEVINYYTAGEGITLDNGQISLTNAQNTYSGWNSKINGATGDSFSDGDTLNFVGNSDVKVIRTAAKEISFTLDTVINTVNSIAIPIGGNIGIGGVLFSDSLTANSGSTLVGVYTGDFVNISSPTSDLQTVLETIDQSLGGSVNSTGSSGYIPKFSDQSTITDSLLYVNANSVELRSLGGVTSEFILMEASGTNYTGFVAPDSLIQDLVYELPNAIGSTDYVLTWQTGNVLEWKAVTAVGPSGDITSVTAGNGLTGGGTSGDVTVSIGSGNGITVGTDNITIKLPTVQNVKNSSSLSGLEVDGDGLSLLSNCSSSNFLVWNGSSWICGTISDASGISNIGDVTSGDAFTASGSTGKMLYFYDVDGRGLLTIDNLTAPRTYTLPDASGTFALLGASQTFSGTNTFTQNVTLNKDDSAFIFDATTATETDFWIANINDSGGNNNDYLRIGVGTAPDSGEVVTVSYDGNLGIGSNQPGTKLDVVGNARFSAVGSGTYANDLNLTVDGTLTTSSSDIRLKTNLKPLSDDTLNKVLSLQPYTFNWADQPNKTDIGLIAQQTANVFPEIVFTNNVDGFMGINYSRIPAILIKAIQEQQGLINSTQNSVEQYKDLPEYVLNILGMQDDKISQINNALNDKSNQEDLDNTKAKIQEIEGKLALLEQLNIALNGDDYVPNDQLAVKSLQWDEVKNSLGSDFSIIAYKDLHVIGTTTTTNFTVTNKANVGLITIDATTGSINSLASKLYLQSSPNAGDVSIFNNLISFESDGTIRSINNTASAYNIAAQSYTMGTNEIGAYSAGRSYIKEGENFVDIETTMVQENSIVIVIPENTTEYPLSVTQKNAGQMFKVEMKSAAPKDIEFSWIIVGVEETSSSIN